MAVGFAFHSLPGPDVTSRAMEIRFWMHGVRNTRLDQLPGGSSSQFGKISQPISSSSETELTSGTLLASLRLRRHRPTAPRCYSGRTERRYNWTGEIKQVSVVLVGLSDRKWVHGLCMHLFSSCTSSPHPLVSNTCLSLEKLARVRVRLWFLFFVLVWSFRFLSIVCFFTPALN